MATVPGRIETLEQLEMVRKCRRCVTPRARYGMFSKPMPASVLLNMPARIVLRAFRRGLYIYKPGTENYHAED